MKCFVNVFIDNLKKETFIKRFRNVSFTTVRHDIFYYLMTFLDLIGEKFV